MSREANLLGALAVAVCDELEAASLAAADLTATQTAALNVLAHHPGCTIRELSQVLELSHPGTVRLVDRLQDEGLVERRSGVDARSVALHVTAAGRRVWNRQRHARDARLAEVVASLPRASRADLRGAAELLLAALTTDEDRAESICRLCDESQCPQDRCPVTLAVS
ncbi:MarR family winged helix-turn-helix transcriptional regulator [Dermatobacter hominis]|uniref:MarR family winged helix-turn-helix transcriptional regulator n=1 Tax=Dermatobacter hominis TaxID=2884263 RepID=UPI001D1041AF|nr:MarR family transcriptional regulator [Dermatobacter hominis]UDY35636.1 MarR family transcriptional regulator [Dermatobacter hominis]